MEEDTSGTLEIRQYAALLLRWLWLIVLAALVAAGAAWFAGRDEVPIYEATATLLVKEGQSATGPVFGDAYRSESLATTYAQLLCTNSIVSEAGDRAGIGADVDEAEVTASQVSGTPIIRLKVRHPDPAAAALLANTIPNVLVEGVNKEQGERLAASMGALKEEMDRVEAEIASTQDSLRAQLERPVPDEVEVGRLENLLAQRRSTYAGLLQSYESIRVSETWGMNTLSIIEPAPVPEHPIPSQRSRNMLLAAVVGAMLAAGVGFLIEYLDDTIKRPDDVERTLHLPTFATVFRFTDDELDASGPLMAAEPRSSTAEAYRVLRTNLQFATASLGRSGVAVLVTSAGPQEGKTTTLVNLGVALAQAGKRVLLVDTDLRRPALHKQFGLANEAGLTTLFLAPDAPVDARIRATGVAGLSVLTSGPIPANPAEILEFPRIAELLAELRQRADYVLFDSPPTLSVADASILAQKADGVLLVAEMGRTRTDVFKNAAATLERVQAQLLGVVLNKVRARRGSYYYYYHYGDYGDGNGRTRKRKRRQIFPISRQAPSREASGRQASAAAPAQSKDPVARAAHSAMNARRRRRYTLRAAYVVGGAAGVVMLGTLALLAIGGRLDGLFGLQPPATATPAPTEVPTAVPAAPIVVPTHTPAPTLTPTERATATAAPSATPLPGPTATVALPTATPAPTAGLHGASAGLRLRDGDVAYPAGQPVAFAIELVNTTAQPLAAGIVGLKPDGGLPFVAAASGVTIQPGATYSLDAQLTFPAAGTYTVVASACFSPEGECRAGTGAWEEFVPGLTVTVQ